MNLDQIEDLLRRYLSAGIAVVVVLVSPLTGGTAAPGAGEVATTQAGQASAPDGQVDILDGTPPDARSGDGTGGTTPADPATEPDGIEPDPVPDTPGPDAPSPDASDSAADTSADTGPDASDSDADAESSADATDSADTDTDAPSSTEPPSAAAPGTTTPRTTTPRTTAPGTTGPGTTGPSTTAPGTDLDADDLADRGPADSDEPGVSDDEDPGSAGPSDEEGSGPADRSASPTTTPRAPDAPGADGQAGDAGNGDADATGPGSAAPTTGAGSADGDEPTGTAATPTTGATAETAGAAAERYGWGTPVQSEDFTSTRLTGWTPYEGPGYDGRGRRSPEAIGVRDGILTITGDEQGTTGGLCWGGGQRYGRWEARLRAPASDVSYNALLLLWPDADDAPVGGEVDFVEMVDPARRSADFYLHFGEDDDQIRSRVEVDGTAWHDWAVEWTPERIVGYVDGEEWFSSTDPATFPPGPMHLCIQLDWFPQGTSEVRESRMEVDRVRQYALDGPAGGGGLLDRMLSWS